MRAQLAVFSVLVAFMASAIVGRICHVPAVLALPALTAMGVTLSDTAAMGVEVVSTLVVGLVSATVMVWLVLRAPLAGRPSAWWVAALVGGFLLSLGVGFGANMLATTYNLTTFPPSQWASVSVARSVGSLGVQAIHLVSTIAVLLIAWSRCAPAGTESDSGR